MEVQKLTRLSPLFFFLLCISFSGYESLQYQTLVLEPLMKPPRHEPDLSWSYSETLSETETEKGEKQGTSLYLRLEHRDSLSNATAVELFQHRLKRDSLRAKAIASKVARRGAQRGVGTKDFSSSIVSGLSQGSGEYFTRIGVGTPVRNTYLVLDTGSDVVWLQCAPCRQCYTQSDPIFDPSKSKSYAALSCQSPICRKLDVSGCGRGKTCLYQVSYGDGSFTLGDFSTETLTFRGAKLPRVALGCGHDNEGLFAGAAGLLGLGRGKLSFPSQAGRRYGGKFSYCLVDRTSSSSRAATSSVIFGPSAIPRSAVFTPMLQNPKLDTFYYVGLVGISIGGTRVKGISESNFRVDANGYGGVIVDSGTSVTRLFKAQYEALRDAFRAGAADLKRTNGFALFDTCYNLAGMTEVKVPTVVLHFANVTDLSLPAANYLIPVDSHGVFCFAFAPTSGMVSIVGNIQQQGFRVVFDGVGSRVGFAPRGCT
ncbi:aspartyl protease family protein 2 [Aristolochia californica]|uniref:aspartyl protease family protein 2 n=1 Tax=Aristolochia californica TaxID=171875 RepID=UPI0035DEDF25